MNSPQTADQRAEAEAKAARVKREFDQAATNSRRLFGAYVEAGWSEAQAFELVKVAIADTMNY